MSPFTALMRECRARRFAASGAIGQVTGPRPKRPGITIGGRRDRGRGGRRAVGTVRSGERPAGPAVDGASGRRGQRSTGPASGDGPNIDARARRRLDTIWRLAKIRSGLFAAGTTILSGDRHYPEIATIRRSLCDDRPAAVSVQTGVRVRVARLPYGNIASSTAQRNLCGRRLAIRGAAWQVPHRRGLR